MYTLRRITSDGLQSNQALGESYNFVSKELNEIEFKKCLDQMKWVDDPEIYGFVSYGEGSKLLALYKKSAYFIMTSGGETFDNLTLKR